MWVYFWVDITPNQWPCDSGFHIPTNTEFSSLCSILTTTYWLTNNWTTLKTYLKMPFSWRRNSSNSNAAHQDSYGYYWTCTHDTNSWYGRNATLYSSYLYSDTNSYCAYWYSIRPFKDTSVTPDGSRTALYSDKIYHSSTLWLISIKNWDNRITIADKNLWATQVYNSWDTLSQSNCWKYYQWWNNYWFDFTWSLTTSSSTVNASTYWPTNYYNSNTFIIINWGWDNSNNTNLRWWDDV